MQNKVIRQYFLIIVFLSLAIALTIRFPMIMNMLFDDGAGGRGGAADHHHGGITPNLTWFFVEIAITFMVAIVMFIMNFFILRPTEKQSRYMSVRIVLAIVLTLLLVSVLNHFLFSISSIFDTRPPGRGRRNEFDLTNFYVSALVVGCVLIIRLIFQKQEIKVENEALKREALQSQFESLKNQLSPHFLFNSLTALKVLIQDAPDKAQNYVSSLSKALRYTLRSNDKQLVTLKDELEFMESYLFLIRMRFDKNLIVNTDINVDLLHLKIPPLTMQTLVENAIKHNEISSRKPLKIEIFSSQAESLFIRNNIQKKFTQEEGTGIGLTNLSKQFLMLIGKDIIITANAEYFTIELPLINKD